MFAPYRKNTVFCTYTCSRANINKTRRNTRREIAAARTAECPWCNTEFRPNSNVRIFCSDKCRSDAKANRSRPAPKPIQCHICRKTFFGRQNHAKYCSSPCRQKAHREIGRATGRNKQYQSNYRKKNNEAVRKSRLKNWYGMSLNDYKNLLSSQGGRCAICQEPLEKPHIDHEHGTEGLAGVRGLLCGPCNHGLGNFKDRIEFLASAIRYLQNYETKKPQS